MFLCNLVCSYDIMKSVLTHIYIIIFVFIQTTHHEWFLQTPKAMWSIVVKTLYIFLNKIYKKKKIKKNLHDVHEYVIFLKLTIKFV